MIAYITGENGVPVSGFIEYRDGAGDLIDVQAISAAGTVLNDQFLADAANVVVWASGYYDFGTPVHTLLDENEFQLTKKPSPVRYIIIGALAFLALSQLSK